MPYGSQSTPQSQSAPTEQQRSAPRLPEPTQHSSPTPRPLPPLPDGRVQPPDQPSDDLVPAAREPVEAVAAPGVFLPAYAEAPTATALVPGGAGLVPLATGDVPLLLPGFAVAAQL